MQSFGYPAGRSDFCIFNLADNPAMRQTWSASAGRIPCPRTNGGKLWSAKRQRWLLATEQLAAFGMPMRRSHIEYSGVPQLPLPPQWKPEHMIGSLFGFHYLSFLIQFRCGN